VRDVLAPEMAYNGIYLHPKVIGKPGHKGGDIRFDRARQDIGNLLIQRNDIFISTMFDYFRIDSQWPGKSEVTRKTKSGSALTAADKAGILEEATRNEIVKNFSRYNAGKRFIPYRPKSSVAVVWGTLSNLINYYKML